MKSLKIAFLYSEGSPSSLRVLDHLLNNYSIEIDTVFVEKATLQKSFQRTRKKLFRQGLVSTLKRIFVVMYNITFRKNAAPLKHNTKTPAMPRYIRIRSFNEIASISPRDSFDIFIASTDTFLKRKVFSIPRYGTLNAHPAKNPGFRGLNSSGRMLEATGKRCITLHLIDEGIDTGPIVLYREIQDIDRCISAKAQEEIYALHQAAAFADGINLLSQKGNWDFIDTFKEVSNHY